MESLAAIARPHEKADFPLALSAKNPKVISFPCGGLAQLVRALA
jgi:hypothetical protein